ncbi:MAG: aspartate/glutamate racemase family protein [Alphaproteobacteria bacterium]|nr:aspartate/glutamate racemase family protein [Alphaproteobacteria bacterium]
MADKGTESMQGGKSVYGARLGILMLETRFPRFPGDVGNAHTWPFPVLYKVVRGASSERVVCQKADGLLDAFKEAATELVSLGADGITTTCGFLSLFQDELAAHAGVPVATSSLMQAPFVQRLLPPGKRVGIITISAEALTEEHLIKAGVDPSTPVVGTEGGKEFTRAIVGDALELDIAAAERDILDAGEALLRQFDDIGAIVLECTNMGPFSRSLAAHVKLPVFDIVSFASWFHAGLSPRRF